MTEPKTYLENIRRFFAAAENDRTMAETLAFVVCIFGNDGTVGVAAIGNVGGATENNSRKSNLLQASELALRVNQEVKRDWRQIIKDAEVENAINRSRGKADLAVSLAYALTSRGLVLLPHDDTDTLTKLPSFA